MTVTLSRVSTMSMHSLYVTSCHDTPLGEGGGEGSVLRQADPERDERGGDRDRGEGGRGGRRDGHQHRLGPHGAQLEGRRLARRRQGEEDHLRGTLRKRHQAHGPQGGHSIA